MKMKKLVAMIIALAMVFTCLPAMAFADEKNDQIAKTEAEVDQQLLDYQAVIMDLVKDQDLLDLYNFVSAEVDKWKEVVDFYVNAVMTGDLDAVLEYAAQLDGYMREVNKYVQAFIDDPEVQAALDEVIKAYDELEKFYEENKDQIPQNEEELTAMLEELQAELEKAIQDLYDSVDKEAVAAAIEEFIAEAEAAAQAWAAEQGITEEMIDEFLAMAEELAALAEEVAADPEAALNDLIEQAKAAFEENKDAIEEALLEMAAEAAEAAYSALENGEFDDALAALGTDKETVQAILDEIANYAVGALLFGETYTDLQNEVVDLYTQLWDMEAQLEEAKAASDDMSAYYEEQIANYKNAIKVLKGKPVLKKVKAKKGKKVQAQFKGLKKTKVLYYQVQIGKKKYTVKKATTTNKLVKSKFLKNKKLKKGKKVAVKVRACYQFEYRVKAADPTVVKKTAKFWSKWSKAKKVKVK